MIAAVPEKRVDARRLFSRRLAPRRRAPRRWNARPAPRLAGRKLVPGFFRSRRPLRARPGRLQVADPHRVKQLHRYETASGCTVAANNAGAIERARQGEFRGGPGPVGDPDWTLEDYQALFRELGWNNYEFYSEETQIYYGRTALDIIRYEANGGRASGAGLKAILSEAPGFVVSDADRIAFAMAVGAIGIASGNRGRAPEFAGGQISQSGFLRAAQQYLGPGFKEVSPGRYVSADGLRQVRFGPHETRGSQMHAHFEAYNQPGGRVIENTRVRIAPDPTP